MKTKSHTRESHTRNTHTRESRTRVIWDFKLWFGGRIWDLGFRTLVRGVGSGIVGVGSSGGKVGQIGKLAEIRRF